VDPRRFGWLSALALASAACSGGSKGSHPPAISGTGVLDAAGGTLAADGATLVVPPGALAGPIAITIAASADPAPAGYRAYSRVYHLEPAGLAFAKPVTVSLPVSILSGADPDNPSGDPRLATLFWSRAGGGFERLAAQVSGGVATATVSHFSSGFTGNGASYLDPPDRSCARTLAAGGRALAGVPAGVALALTAEDCQGRPLAGLSCTGGTCDFTVDEDGVALAAASPTALPAPGRQGFVTLLLDVSPSVGPDLGPMIEAAKAFVLRLRIDLALPIEIGVAIFGGEDMNQGWVAPTLDTEQLIAQLDALAAARLPVAAADLYGALGMAMTAQAQVRAAFEARNGGGALTASYLVAFTADPDMLGLATPAQVDAVRRSTGTWLAILPMARAGLDPAPLAALGDAALSPTPGSASLYRDFLDLAGRVAGRFAALYPVAYCSPARSGAHTARVKVRGAASDASGTAASFAFDATGFADGCTAERLKHPCAAGVRCGGDLCGACDDRTDECDLPTGTCVSWCRSLPVCGGQVATHLGYSQHCPDRPASTLCSGLCIDVRTDLANCGGCGWRCGEPAGGPNCAEGVCGCPAPKRWCAPGQCIDVTSALISCGACGHACTGNEQCVTGACKPDPVMPEGPIPPEIPVDYDLSVAGVVHDDVTGLTWQRAPPATTGLTFLEAYASCAGLSLAGPGTWRLPTRSELLGIADSSRLGPAVNVQAFPDLPSGKYWTGFGTTVDGLGAGVGATYFVDLTDGSCDWIGTSGPPVPRLAVICVR
jgi:hypothetical protein